MSINQELQSMIFKAVSSVVLSLKVFFKSGWMSKSDQDTFTKILMDKLDADLSRVKSSLLRQNKTICCMLFQEDLLPQVWSLIQVWPEMTEWSETFLVLKENFPISLPKLVFNFQWWKSCSVLVLKEEKRSKWKFKRSKSTKCLNLTLVQLKLQVKLSMSETISWKFNSQTQFVQALGKKSPSVEESRRNTD